MVEWKKLGEVCTLERGVRVVRKNLLEIGHIPVFQNSLTPLGYFGKSNYPEHTPFVICAGAAGEIGYSNVPFWAADDCTCVICHSYVISKYVYYYLLVKQHALKSQVRKASVPRLSKNVIEKLLIPIPSLSEQNRIVGILDTFTDSIENLKQQIAQRRKQFEFYRDHLLDLEGKEGVEMKTLGDFGNVTKLAGFEFTEHVTYQESGTIIALRGLNVRKGSLDLSQVKYIDGSNFSKLERSKLIVNDMLFTYVGTIGNVALIDENDKYYLAPNVSRIRFDNSVVLPKFALYYFLSDYFNRTQINKYLNSSSMKNLSMENIRKFKLLLPPLSEQSRIVSILDTFEASISNLEAQLAQRQKQYEYYRNKLLTFE